MDAYCLLEIFREKEYIVIEKHHREGTISLPPYFIVRVKVTKEIIPKMLKVVSNDDGYLCHYYEGNDYFYYTRVGDMLQFMKKLKEMNEEHIYFGRGHFNYLQKYEQKWIDENTQFWCKEARIVINKEIRGKRMMKEKKDNEDAIDLINKLTLDTPSELIFNDIKNRCGYDYTYTPDDGHPVQSHKKIVPSFKNAIEIFSSLYDHDLEYNSEFGPNREYLEKSLKEIERMEAIKKEIEKTYENKVKCILSDWNEGCQFGCVLYVYIL